MTDSVLKPWRATLIAGALLLLAGCQMAQKTLQVLTGRSAPTAAPADKQPVPAERISPLPSTASTPLTYRESGARHLYKLNQNRIYPGRMPPMLYAVGVLDIELDRSGRVTRLDWRRAPRHAPEVMKEIERTVRAASPFPAPTRLGRVVYTDVWLWHESGRFQLDTLTEGQD